MSTTRTAEKKETAAATATLRVANETADLDEVKICLYSPGDGVDWVPVGAGVFVVTKDHPVYWKPPEREVLDGYHLKAFKPGLIDGFLAAADVKLGDSVAVRGARGGYTVEFVAG